MAADDLTSSVSRPSAAMVLTSLFENIPTSAVQNLRKYTLSYSIASVCTITSERLLTFYFRESTLRWRHNGCDSVSNHLPHDCLLNRLFRRRSKKTSKLCVTGLCAGNSPETGEFLAQMASNAENVSIWWRHHDLVKLYSWDVKKRVWHHCMYLKRKSHLSSFSTLIAL